MTQSELEELFAFQVQALTLARVRKLIEAECQDRCWLMQDIDWWEVKKNG